MAEGTLLKTKYSHLACVNYCLTTDSPACDMRIKPPCFFILSRPSEGEPPRLFDSPALPLLSTLYLAILDAACYVLSIYVKVVSKSKISTRMEEEANARLAFHLISLKM